MDLLRRYIWVVVIVGILFTSAVIVLIFLLINKCISRQGKMTMLRLHRGLDNKIESNKYQERNIDTKNPPLPPRTQFLTAEAQSYENLAEAEGSDGEQSVADYEQIDDQQFECEEDAGMLPPPPPDPNSNLKPGDAVAQSYENLAEDHDYEESTDQQPDYISVEDETAVLSPPVLYSHAVPSLNRCVSVGQSYENLAEDHDYEESTDQQPDYISVEDETAVLSPPVQDNDAVPGLNHCVSVGDSYENLAEDHDYEESTDQQSDYVKVEDEEPADPAADNSSTEDYDDIGGEDENQDEDDYDDVV